MFVLLSSHCPLIPYAAGSAPRTTQVAPDFTQPVSGTDPVSTAWAALASVVFSFGRMVWLIRCRPAAKQNVVPAGLEFTIDWAFWPGLIVTPWHEPANAGPAAKCWAETVGFFVGFADGDVVLGGFDETVAGGVTGVFDGGCDEIAPVREAIGRDLAAVVAFFWWAMTGTATATTATAATPAAANHNFLNITLRGWRQEFMPAETRCSHRET